MSIRECKELNCVKVILPTEKLKVLICCEAYIKQSFDRIIERQSYTFARMCVCLIVCALCEQGQKEQTKC